MMQWLHKNGLQIGQFDVIHQLPGFVHGCSTRVGGVSRGAYASLNLGSNTADSPDDVHENRRCYFSALGYAEDDIAVPGQVHGETIALVEKPGFYAETDGLITNTPGVLLTIQTADCLPVFLVDPVQRAIGLFHAGWRGTAGAIVTQGIEKMVRTFGTLPENLRAAIGPGIGPCCFAVGPDVLKHFPQHSVGERHVDLWAANKQQLVASGIKNVYISKKSICTYCQQNLFYSHRRDQGVTGRMMAALGLNFI